MIHKLILISPQTLWNPSWCSPPSIFFAMQVAVVRQRIFILVILISSFSASWSSVISILGLLLGTHSLGGRSSGDIVTGASSSSSLIGLNSSPVLCASFSSLAAWISQAVRYSSTRASCSDSISNFDVHINIIRSLIVVDLREPRR